MEVATLAEVDSAAVVDALSVAANRASASRLFALQGFPCSAHQTSCFDPVTPVLMVQRLRVATLQNIRPLLLPLCDCCTLGTHCRHPNRTAPPTVPCWRCTSLSICRGQRMWRGERILLVSGCSYVCPRCGQVQGGLAEKVSLGACGSRQSCCYLCKAAARTPMIRPDTHCLRLVGV